MEERKQRTNEEKKEVRVGSWLTRKRGLVTWVDRMITKGKLMVTGWVDRVR